MTSQRQISANNYKYKFSETIKIATTLYVSKIFVALLSKNLAVPFGETYGRRHS